MSVLILSPNGKNRPKVDLSSAVASADVANKTIENTSPITLTTDVTIPTTVTLKISKNGIVTIASGVTLIINGAFEAGQYQCFNCVGTGKVVFGSREVVPTSTWSGPGTGAVQGWCYPEWWGAVAGPNGVEATNTLAFQRVYDQGPYEIRYTGLYKVTGMTLSATHAHKHKGYGRYTTGLLGSGIQANNYANSNGSGDANPEITRAIADGGKKFVIQNGVQGSGIDKDVFEDMMIAGTDIDTVVAVGILGGYNSAATQFGYNSTNCFFYGYIGWFYQWENIAYHSGTLFQGKFAAVSAQTYNVAFGSTIEKIHFGACQFTQNDSVSGGAIVYLKDTTGSAGNITGWTFSGGTMEGGNQGFYIDHASKVVIINPHFEGLTQLGAQFTSIDSTVTWIEPKVQDGLNQILSTMGVYDILYADGAVYYGSGVFIQTAGNGAKLGQVATGNVLNGWAGYFSETNSQVNRLLTTETGKADLNAQVEQVMYKSALTSANFTNVFSMLFGAAYQTALLEVEVLGQNSDATVQTLFKGVRSLKNANTTVTYTTVGTDITDGGATDIDLTNDTANNSILSIKAAAASTDAMIRIRILAGTSGTGAFGVTVTQL